MVAGATPAYDVPDGATVRHDDAMSVPTPPYGAAWAPPPAKPQRRRPSAWWFALGIGFIVAAVVSLVVGILLAVSSIAGFLDVDATIPGDGRPHVVTVPADGERMLWTEFASAQDCRIVDTDSGEEVDQRSVGGDYRREDGSGDWVGITRFDPGSGHLEVTCPAGGGRGQIGPAPRISHFVGGLLLVILVPLGLGTIGTISLIVTGILYSTGRPRNDGPSDPRAPDTGADDAVVKRL